MGKGEGVEHSHFISRRKKKGGKKKPTTKNQGFVLLKNCPRIKILCIYHIPTMQRFMQCTRCYYTVSQSINRTWNASHARYAALTPSLDESYLFAFYHSSMLMSSPKRLVRSLIDQKPITTIVLHSLSMK